MGEIIIAILGVILCLAGIVGCVIPALPGPPLNLAALFLLAIVCYHVPTCQAFYLRAHKRDPLFAVSVVASLLVGAGVWWFGSRHGPTGAAWAYLAIVACVVSPWQTMIWWQTRRRHPAHSSASLPG